MTPQDVKKIKRVAFTLIKIGGYALDAIAIVELASGFKGIKFKKPIINRKPPVKRTKFKVPKRIS